MLQHILYLESNYQKEEYMRTIIYDNELKLEAYRLNGIIPSFPNHFHENYVIGYVKHGKRVLLCKNKEYTINDGFIVIFNPGDNHSCVQKEESTLEYCGLNISKNIMLSLTEKLTGRHEMPCFSQNVIYDKKLFHHLHTIHKTIMDKTPDTKKEENLQLFFSSIIQKYGLSCNTTALEYKYEIERVCNFMKKHYTEHISLEQLCRNAGLSKSSLLRIFTKAKGVTPYRYLENIRINKAKKLLANGVFPIDVSIQTGFSDQSHFTNYFTKFVGLPPGVYRSIFLNSDKDGENHEK